MTAGAKALYGASRYRVRAMKPYELHVFVCTYGDTCPTQGSKEVRDWLKAEAKKVGLKTRVRVNQSGCFSQCGHGPMMVVYPEGVWYAHVSLADAKRILEEHIVGGKRVADLVYQPPRPGANQLPRDPETKRVLVGDPAYVPCSRCPRGD